MSTNEEAFWTFTFNLESVAGDPLAKSVPAELLEHILRWAEDRDLQVGGGFHGPKAIDFEAGPVFEVDDTDASA
ncbi:MAG: hypothetical protein KDA89_01380 [Planctomycetaceae bacterium]|nr:hypothetical protein [Planctomycetaceae bacterium]